MKTHFAITTLLLTVCTLNSLAIDQREVSFTNGSVQLKGTLYLPKGDQTFPAVVFVHGSGPETRSNSRYSAKWLASIGYIALTYDKRGSGESDGEEKEWNRFSIETLAEDVVAAINFLSEQEEADPNKIGVHASSQGGWVATHAAAKTDLISFMVIRSASVCSIGEDRIFERSARLKQEGFSDSDIKEANEMQKVEAKTISGDNSPDQFTQLFDKYKDKPWFSRVYGGTDPFTQSLISYRKWYATIVDVNTVTFLEQIDIPIFWIFGDPILDKKGPVEKSLNTLKELSETGKSYKIMRYEGEGHNVKEREYEFALYEWLIATNGDYGFRFRKH